MKKVTIVLLVYMTSVMHINASNHVLDTLDLLTSKFWIADYDVNNQSEYFSYNEYDNGKVISTNVWHGVKMDTYYHYYYLSNDIEESFDSTKVGKVLNGMYIIAEHRALIFKDHLIGAKLTDGLNLSRKIRESLELGIVDTSLISQYRQHYIPKDTLDGKWVTSLKTYKIIKITHDELIYQYIPKEGEIRIGEPRPVRFIPYSGKKNK